MHYLPIIPFSRVTDNSVLMSTVAQKSRLGAQLCDEQAISTEPAGHTAPRLLSAPSTMSQAASAAALALWPCFLGRDWRIESITTLG